MVSGDWGVVRWPDGDWWGEPGVGIELGCDAMRGGFGVEMGGVRLMHTWRTLRTSNGVFTFLLQRTSKLHREVIAMQKVLFLRRDIEVASRLLLLPLVKCRCVSLSMQAWVCFFLHATTDAISSKQDKKHGC